MDPHARSSASSDAPVGSKRSGSEQEHHPKRAKAHEGDDVSHAAPQDSGVEKDLSKRVGEDRGDMSVELHMDHAAAGLHSSGGTFHVVGSDGEDIEWC